MSLPSSLLRCAGYASLAVCALLVASIWGKKSPRQARGGRAAPSSSRMTLAAGQTIIGVEETATVLRFYLGNSPRAAGEAA